MVQRSPRQRQVSGRGDIIGFYPGIELSQSEQGAPASYLLILAPLFISRLFPILGPPQATANVFKNRRIMKKKIFDCHMLIRLGRVFWKMH